MNKVVLLVSVFLVAGLANASQLPYDGPLFAKYSNSGFVPANYVNSLKCEVFADKVVVTKSFSGVSVTSETSIKLEGDVYELTQAIKDAKKLKSTGPTDGPVTSYIVYANEGAGFMKEVTFDSTGELIISTPNLPQAQFLKQYLDSACN